MPRQNLSTFTDAYIECACWSSSDDAGVPLDQIDAPLSNEALTLMRDDCRAFFLANESLILDDNCIAAGGLSSVIMAGHDFWLSRNGHGAGFWDGDWKEPFATALDNAAKSFDECDLYVGDDGKIYI